MALKKKITRSGTTEKKKTRKAPAKRTARKKAAKKKAAKKKTVKKKTAKKAEAKRARTSSAGTKRKKKAGQAPSPAERFPAKEPLVVEPGPPSGSIPPVEEPVPQEEAIGIVTHYYSHLGVAVVQLNKGTLRTGDTIHVKGHSSDFTQTVASLEYEHHHVDQAAAGQAVGIKVVDHAREHDILYLVK